VQLPTPVSLIVSPPTRQPDGHLLRIHGAPVSGRLHDQSRCGQQDVLGIGKSVHMGKR
jgi:hypothetical protein